MASDHDVTLAQQVGELTGEVRAMREDDRRRWDDFRRDDAARWERLEELIVLRGTRLRSVERRVNALWIAAVGLAGVTLAWIQQHFFKG